MLQPNNNYRGRPNGGRQGDGTRINEEIRISPIRLVKNDGESVIIETSKALQMAKDEELDLVEVSPNAKPPVCRIMDYGKYKFEQTKRAKQAKAKQHVMKQKEIKLRPKTAQNDYNYRIEAAKEFLKEGNKVRLLMQFRGREIAHMDYGRRLMDQAKIDLSEFGEIDMDAKMEGNTMLSIFSPKKGVVAAAKAEKSKAAEADKAPKPATEQLAAGEA